jgi:hypothetical protein
MLFIVQSLFIFLLTSCSSAPVNVTTTENNNYFDFRPRQKLFWEKAKDKPFNERLKLWDEYVEGKYSPVYKALMWRGLNEKDSQYFKIANLFMTFNLYDTSMETIQSDYVDYIKSTKTNISTFKNKFPKAKLDADVYILPLGLNPILALAGIGESNYGLKRTMVLNSDMLSLANTRVDQAILHELVHLYRFEILMNTNIPLNKTSLTMTIFEEGLATYISDKLYRGPEANSSFYGLEQAQSKYFERLQDYAARKGLNLEEQLKRIPKITKYSHCHNTIKKDIPIKFDCSYLYEIGNDFIKHLVRKKEYKIEDLLYLNEVDINTNLREFLEKKSSEKNKNILAHL